MALKVIIADDNKIDCSGGDKANKPVMNSIKNNKSRNLIYILNIKAIEELIFLTLNTKKIFYYL